MEKINVYGPAFPHPPIFGSDGFIAHSQGMTLRQWYAGQALPSIISRYPNEIPRECARMSFEVADAMIKAGDDQE